jgi:hypothetical protein
MQSLNAELDGAIQEIRLGNYVGIEPLLVAKLVKLGIVRFVGPRIELIKKIQRPNIRLYSVDADDGEFLHSPQPVAIFP